MAAVLTASEGADGAARQVTAEDLARIYPHISNCDPYEDILFAEIEGKVVGYVRGWWKDEAPVLRLYQHNGFLIPEWRRKGIGQVLLQWVEKRLKQIKTMLPPIESHVYQGNVSQAQTGALAMLENAGYQAVRYFYHMLRPNLDEIPELPLPEGLKLRPPEPAHYPAIWESIGEASQEEWGYKEPTEEDYQQWLDNPHFQPHLWQIAWDVETDQTVGHVLTFIDREENQQFNRKRGYMEGIGVLPAWRRRGVATALITRSLQAQKEAGMAESALVVDGENPNATRLYEKCGFEVIHWDAVYRKNI